MNTSSLFWVANGVRTHGVVVQPDTSTQNQPRLVLLHGWGGSAQKSFAYNDGLADVLVSSLNAAVLCVDVPGFGGSDMPPTVGWGTQDYAIWLEETLAQFELPSDVPLLGHSNGGRILLRHAQQYPQPTRLLILIGSAGIKLPPSLRQRVARILSPLKSVAKFLLPSSLYTKALRHIFGARDWTNAPENLKNTLKKILEEEGFQSFLPEIQNPCLLLWGEHDTYTPMCSARQMDQLLPHSTLHTYPDGKHGLHHTHTATLAGVIIEFLQP